MTVAIATAEPSATLPRTSAGKYLTFALAGQEYGLPVLRVREIIKILEIATVPQMPHHVKGVINLRGRVIPVVDLRLKFGFPSQEYGERTCVIVVEVAPQASRTMIGVVVDTVSEVLTIDADEIVRMPDGGGLVNNEFVKGVATIRGKVRILLDLDRIFGGVPLQL